MSSINLTDLQIAGNEFFADAEGFLSELQTTELTTKELKQTHGGGVSGGITINGQILFSSGGGKKSKGGGIFFYTNGTGQYSGC